MEFLLNNQLIQKPRLLGTSKVGRLSWFAYLDGQPVKIYECHNEAHAAFVESVSNNPLLADHFPAILFRQGAYLVVQWVIGRPVRWRAVRLRPELLRQIAELQASLHTQRSTDPAEFSFKDALLERLNRYKGIFPFDDAIQEVQTILDGCAPSAEERISHPDVTAINVIVEKSSGALKLIDNELMGYNNYYLIDLFNTVNSCGSRHAKYLVEPYLIHYVESGGDLTLIARHKRFFNTLWGLRLVGTLVQAGEVEAAFRMAHQYAQGSVELHPLIQLVKDKFT